jgi:ribose transport system substrate-binding protein
VLNDEETGGRIAAQRLAEMLHGRGTIALLGINSDVIGIVTRARSMEDFLSKNYPKIHIVAKRMGTFNEPHEQQVAEEALKTYPHLDAIVALSPASIHGLLSAIDRQTSRVRVIAFDRDDDAALMFDVSNLDSVIVQDTQRMGSEAVRQILWSLEGRPMTPITQFEPVLLTRENIDAKMRELGSMINMWPPESRWKWMVGP